MRTVCAVSRSTSALPSWRSSGSIAGAVAAAPGRQRTCGDQGRSVMHDRCWTARSLPRPRTQSRCCRPGNSGREGSASRRSMRHPITMRGRLSG
jgi:hypothetical protein